MLGRLPPPGNVLGRDPPMLGRDPPMLGRDPPTLGLLPPNDGRETDGCETEGRLMLGRLTLGRLTLGREVGRLTEGRLIDGVRPPKLRPPPPRPPRAWASAEITAAAAINAIRAKAMRFISRFLVCVGTLCALGRCVRWDVVCDPKLCALS